MVDSTGIWLIVAGVGGVLVAALVLRWAQPRPADGGDSGLLMLQQQLDALRGQLGQALTGQGQTVTQELQRLATQLNDRMRESAEATQRSQAAVGERLDNASRVVVEVHAAGN